MTKGNLNRKQPFGISEQFEKAVNRSQLHALAVGHIDFHHHTGIALLPVAYL